MRGEERIPGVPVATQEEALSTGKVRGTTVVPPFPESPKCLSPFQGNLFSLNCLYFQAEDRLTPRWTWDSPVGKPRGKALRESHRSLDPREGKHERPAHIQRSPVSAS